MRRFVRAVAGVALVGAACVPDLGGFTGGGAADAGSDAPIATAPPPPPAPPRGDDASADAGADVAADVTCTLPTSVQTAHTVADPDAGASTTVAVTLTNAQRAGDFLVVGVNYDQGGCVSVSSVTDTAGDKFTAIVAPDSLPGALALETWGASNVAAAAAADNQVTVTFGGSCDGKNVKVAEYASVDVGTPVDAFVSSHGTSAAPSATIATTHAAMLFAHSADDHSATMPGVGWTLLFLDDWATLAEERAAPAPGMHLVDYANNEVENWVLQAVALRAVCR